MLRTGVRLVVFLAFATGVVLVRPGRAQDWYGAATYQISFPLGDTKTFANKTSFRGIGFDFRKTVSPSTTLGVTFGWNVFHRRVRETLEIDTENPGAVTGVQDRTINAFPIMLNVHRYFGHEGGVQPFVGLNAGGYIMAQRFDIGLFTFQKDQWQWGVAPEIGFAIPLQSGSTLFINGKYNYAFTGKSAVGTDVNNSYISVGIGFAWLQY